MSLLQHALAWLDRGFHVFPLQPRGKNPLGLLVPHGCKDASVDPAVIRDWWRREPRANIGGRLGDGRFVVDLDGQDAVEWFANACERHGGAPRTLTVRTARGWHLYFASHVPVPCSVGRIATGVDIREARSYIVLPPSEHPSGHIYTVRRDLPVIEAPQWLVDLAKPPKPAFVPPPPTLQAEGRSLRSVDGVLRTVATATPGERNRKTYWAACRLKEKVAEGLISFSLAEELLVAVGASTGLASREIIQTMRSAERGRP
jgi:hypothetical protein